MHARSPHDATTEDPADTRSAAPHTARSELESAWLDAVWHRTPTVAVKRDLLPAISVLSLVALVGLGVAWVWSRLAPPDQVLFPVGATPVWLTESDFHVFDALAIFVMLSLLAGILIGAATWLLRERRGPVVLIAAVVGAVIGGWLAIHSGPSFAGGLYTLSGVPKGGDIITRAPALVFSEGGGWASFWQWCAVLAVQPLGIALAYVTMVMWNGMPDLGRRLG